jgi:hypothetical protein
MTTRDRVPFAHVTWAHVTWALASLFCLAVLAAPALWNGFPLLQWDTGGYLARWYEGTLVPSRAVAYGLILNAGSWGDFWPVVLLQSALTVWVIAIVLRVHGLARPFILAGVIAALSIVTTLPWLTAILLTDIFCGLGVLALYLIMMRRDRLIRGERTALGLLVAVAAATHSATLAVLGGLVIVAGLVRLARRAAMPGNRLRAGIIAVAFGAALVPLANDVVAGRLVWTPGGFALSFGRMLQDGIVAKYLDAHCPDPRLRLCAHKDALPRDADQWFWGSDLFDRLGRFAGLGREMEAIALGSVTEFPLLQAQTAATAAARQLVDMRTGEGVLDTIWHTYSIIERYVPAAVPAMKAARQQHGAAFGFETLNLLHWPVGLLAMALLPLIVSGFCSPALRSPALREARELAAVIALTVLGNAVVCGVFSNPHDRYGARVVWLATFAVLVAGLSLRPRRDIAPR